MITVHYLEQSRAQRILWLLEELGLDYDVQIYARTEDYLAPKELLNLHPLGKSPVITDGEVVVAESGAIFEYLLEAYNGARLVPDQGSESWRRYVYWMYAAEGSAMPLIKDKLVFQRIPDRVPFPLRGFARIIFSAAIRRLLDPDLARQIAYWESELEKGGWFAGEAFTAADIMMSFVVEAGVTRIEADRPLPAVSAYLHNCRERSAYKRALQRAEGRYAYSTSQVS